MVFASLVLMKRMTNNNGYRIVAADTGIPV